MTIYYGDHLLLSDEKLRLKQSNPINTEHFEQSFRLQLADREELIKQFELFIQKNWNSSLLPNMDDSLFCQFTNNILSKNIYSKSKTSKTKTYLLYIMNLRDIISQTIDILYPLYIAYNVKNILIKHADGYCKTLSMIFIMYHVIFLSNSPKIIKIWNMITWMKQIFYW